VLLGGLVTSLALSLVVVPILYLRFAPSAAAEEAAEPEPAPEGIGGAVMGK
jgi:hypothetical protein